MDKKNCRKREHFAKVFVYMNREVYEMKKALLRRKRKKPSRMKKKVVSSLLSKKESEKKGKYTRSKIKHEVDSIIREEVRV